MGGGRESRDGGLLIGMDKELGDGQTRENIGSRGYRRVPKGSLLKGGGLFVLDISVDPASQRAPAYSQPIY